MICKASPKDSKVLGIFEDFNQSRVLMFLFLKFFPVLHSFDCKNIDLQSCDNPIFILAFNIN